MAFPQFPLQSFVPGAGLRPREAGDASTKAQQLQPACKVTFAAKGCRSAACQRLPSAQEPGKTGDVCDQGVFRRTGSLSGEKEKLGFPCTPGCRGFVTLLLKGTVVFCWDYFKPTKELVLSRMTLGVVSPPALLWMLFQPTSGWSSAQHFTPHQVTESDRLKTSFHDPKPGSRQGFCVKPHHPVRPKPHVLVPTIFILGTTGNINIPGSC